MRPSVRPRVFISYRQRETSELTRALQVELVRALGDDHVFFDRASMAAGRSLDTAIPDAVRQADVVLAVVGHHWLEDFESRRETRDDVRVELGEAIAHRKLVVPVVLEDAQWPPIGDWPAELSSMARLLPQRLRNSDWSNDVRALLDVIGAPKDDHSAAAVPGSVVSGNNVTIVDSQIIGGDMTYFGDSAVHPAVAPGRRRKFGRRAT